MEIAIIVIGIVLIVAVSYVINYLKFRTQQMMYGNKGCGCGVAIMIVIAIMLFLTFLVIHQTLRY